MSLDVDKLSNNYDKFLLEYLKDLFFNLNGNLEVNGVRYYIKDSNVYLAYGNLTLTYDSNLIYNFLKNTYFLEKSDIDMIISEYAKKRLNLKIEETYNYPLNYR